jgi:hypothetical protein
MKSVLGRARAPVVGVAAACLLAIGAGWAIAASTTSTATIHACASKSTGVLRLARTCKTSERSVGWNTVGPRGPRGLRGIQGAKGDRGLCRGPVLKRCLGLVVAADRPKALGGDRPIPAWRSTLLLSGAERPSGRAAERSLGEVTVID